MSSTGDFKKVLWPTGLKFDMGKVVPALQALVKECTNKNCFPTSDQVCVVLAKILEDQMTLARNRAESSNRSDSSASTIVGMNPSNKSGDDNKEEQESGSARSPVISDGSASGHASAITKWVMSLETGEGSD
jgi:hypothetical protein